MLTRNTVYFNSVVTLPRDNPLLWEEAGKSGADYRSQESEEDPSSPQLIHRGQEEAG